MTYVGILLVAGTVAAIEVPGLLRRGARRELAAVVTILLLATAYAVAQAMKLPLPTVSEIVKWLALPMMPR